MSKAGVPLIADLMVHFDALNELYSRILNNLGTPLHLRHAADRGQVVLNKYYSKTDESELYQLALCEHLSILTCLIFLTVPM